MKLGNTGWRAWRAMKVSVERHQTSAGPGNVFILDTSPPPIEHEDNEFEVAGSLVGIAVNRGVSTNRAEAAASTRCRSNAIGIDTKPTVQPDFKLDHVVRSRKEGIHPFEKGIV